MASYYTLRGSYPQLVSLKRVLTPELVSRTQGALKSKLYVEATFGGVTQRTKVIEKDHSWEETLPL